MSIRDYIKKHGLKLWRKWPEEGTYRSAINTALVSRETVSFGPMDQFEIYANDEQTHLVSINLTAEQFKIVHRDLIEVQSVWHQFEPIARLSPLE